MMEKNVLLCIYFGPNLKWVNWGQKKQVVWITQKVVNYESAIFVYGGKKGGIIIWKMKGGGGICKLFTILSRKI